MRPPELDVTFALSKLFVKKTEDSGGDEPYLWVLGFKIDADTLLAPNSDNPLVPTVTVQVEAGPPHSPFIQGADPVNARSSPWSIPEAVGTRSFHLRPKFLDLGGWFDGFGGLVCLLWDQDNFSKSTSEVGHAAFNDMFGDKLAEQLNLLLKGDPGYDSALSKDAGGNPSEEQPRELNLLTRLRRLADPVGMANVVEEITSRLRSSLKGPLTDTLKEAAGWDELLDRDDLLGVQVVVFTARQLQSVQPISLRFTGHEADYEVVGFASGSRVHRHRLNSSVLSVARQWIDVTDVETRVCWFPSKWYRATTYRQVVTTRVAVTALGGTPPLQVRWLLDGRPLEGPVGTIAVTFEPAASMYSGPAAKVATDYPGGAGTLKYAIDGATLDLTNAAGDGVFYGTVRAAISYEGDPPLQGSLDGPALLDRGYELSHNFSVISLEVQMSDEYAGDVEQCFKTVKDIDRKRIPVNLGKAKIIPGDLPPTKDSLQRLSRWEALIESGLAGPALRDPIDSSVGEDWTQVERLRSLERLRIENVISDDELNTIRARIIRHT